MMRRKAALEMKTLGEILLLTAFLIIFLLMFKGCQDQMANVGTVGFNEYACWFSQTLKAEATFLFPSTCSTINVKEAQNKKGIATLMRKCWWMNGQGEKDIVTGARWPEILKKKVIPWEDIARNCYAFTPSEDISFQDFETYLTKYDKSGEKVSGTEEKDLKKTTWWYIQKTSSEKTGICFDKKIEKKLQKGKLYFIIFYDDRGPIATGARDRILISRDPGFGEVQTGFKEWVVQGFKKDRCENWREEATAASEEASKELDAIPFFNNLVAYLKECAQVTSPTPCYCGLKLDGAPEGYSVKFEKIADRKYKATLLKGKEAFQKDGKKFEEEIGGRLGLWSQRSINSGICGLIGQDNVRSPYIESLGFINTFVVHHPNTEFRSVSCKDKAGEYVTGELYMSMAGINKKCSEAMSELEAEKMLNLEEDNKASEIFDKILSKFETCAQISTTVSCLCDDSSTSAADLSLDYSIEIEKKSKGEYIFKLSHKQRGVIKEKTINMNVGVMGLAENDVKNTQRGPSSTVIPQTLCTEGLGLISQLSLSERPFSLIYNTDSRFYLQTTEDISPCTDIQKDVSGSYKGLYMYLHTYDTQSAKWYLDTAKLPVLKYCSGNPVSAEAAQEIQKRLCESYNEADCKAHLDKCYPYIALTKFTSCKHCGTQFNCGEILSETACNLDPCLKNCIWQSTSPTGGVCLDE